MSSALEVAAELLPHFRDAVLRGNQHTYGYYANAIGRGPGKEGPVIGKAMHGIGAACIFTCVPVAPIHFVERADGEWRGLFESTFEEQTHVAPQWEVLAVSARIYQYTEGDFLRIGKALTEVIPKHFPAELQTPRKLWWYIVYGKAVGETTWLQRAIATYEQIIAKARSEREPKQT